jgi:hypothetical protein
MVTGLDTAGMTLELTMPTMTQNRIDNPLTLRCRRLEGMPHDQLECQVPLRLFLV